MAPAKPLFLYEELMLLALRNKTGTVATGYVEYAIAAAVLAELLLERRISIDESRKHLVDLCDARPIGDPIIDECLEKMEAARRRGSLKTWVSRIARIAKLRHKAARRLCDRGILRADHDTILFVFTRRIYPELNPEPEKKIIGRLREAIFTDVEKLDPRTVVLVSLANAVGLLGANFDRRELKTRKKRIAQITNGELTGKAAKELIDAVQAAVVTAAMMPMIMNTIN